MVITEAVRINEKRLSNIFKKDFLEKLKIPEGDIFPIFSLEKKEMKKNSTIILRHNSRKEVDMGILHIESQDEKSLKLFIKLFKEVKNEQN